MCRLLGVQFFTKSTVLKRIQAVVESNLCNINVDFMSTCAWFSAQNAAFGVQRKENGSRSCSYKRSLWNAAVDLAYFCMAISVDTRDEHRALLLYSVQVTDVLHVSFLSRCLWFWGWARVPGPLYSDAAGSPRRRGVWSSTARLVWHLSWHHEGRSAYGVFRTAWGRTPGTFCAFLSKLVAVMARKLLTSFSVSFLC